MEEFGFDEPVVPIDRENIADLEALIGDLTKQLASTMDEKQRQPLLRAKQVAVEALNVLRKQPVETKTEGQWLDLAKAYEVFWGNKTEFTDVLKGLGGQPTSEAFETLRSKLARAHELRPTTTETDKPKKEKKTAAKPKGNEITVPLPTPQTRWPHIVEHGKNIGVDAQLVFDELGFTALTDLSVSDTLREMNARKERGGVEEFGLGESAITAVTEKSSESPASDAPATVAVTIQGRVDEETGELLDRDWVLDKLGWLDYPAELTEEQADQLIDLVHKYRQPAQRYRDQAEKRAKPLEQRADAISDTFGPLLDKFGDKRLPRYQSDSKEGTKNPHKRGDFSKKTLDLGSGSISWTKDGGVAVVDQGRYFGWLQRQYETFCHQNSMLETGSPEEKELAKQVLDELQTKYGFRVKIVPDASKDLVKKLPINALPDGWADIPVNEFARRIIK